MDATTTVGRRRCLTQVSQLLNLLDPSAVQRSGGLAVHGGLGCNLEEQEGRVEAEIIAGVELEQDLLSPVHFPTAK